jgi:hypothetical protein
MKAPLNRLISGVCFHHHESNFSIDSKHQRLIKFYKGPLTFLRASPSLNVAWSFLPCEEEREKENNFRSCHSGPPPPSTLLLLAYSNPFPSSRLNRQCVHNTPVTTTKSASLISLYIWKTVVFCLRFIPALEWRRRPHDLPPSCCRSTETWKVSDPGIVLCQMILLVFW